MPRVESIQPIRQRRLVGKRIIEEQARSQVRSFLDELKNGTTNYRTVASLGDQVAQEYRGRAVLELLQNAHDVLAFASSDDPRRISFVLNSSPEHPELLIANSGRPFRREDFSGICQLGQSPKDPNESVGNKGLGFRSVLELTTRPEVWSTAPAGADAAFTFGFDPDVLDPIARVAKRLFDDDVSTVPKFGAEPVVDWSDRQIEEYRGRLSRNGIKPVAEVTKYLSPYVLPHFLGDPPREVAELLADGHVTVIRLPLDGGKAGTLDDDAKENAVESVRNQLRALDEAAMVFLHHLSVVSITIDGECDEFLRSVDPQLPFPALAARRERVRVARAGSEAPDATERSFHVWSRTVGGGEQPDETEQIKDAVLHLPNRWPEVRKVEVAVSVEETTETRKGVYVVFLPTKMKTTVGAHINAPFYASLDRQQIDFQDPYNKLLLDFVKKLMRDAVEALVASDPEPWRGRAVMDLLAPVPDSSEAKKGPPLTGALRELGFADERILDDEALVLCDDGWRLPGVVRTMPAIPYDDPFGEAEWRAQVGFAVASSALDERREALEALLRALDGSPNPRVGEWVDTLSGMAKWIGGRQAAVNWNDFLRSAIAILPRELIAEPTDSDADSLVKARFLPTETGQLRSASDAVRIFFQPRRSDDAADFVGSVPVSLRQRIAFLHHDIKTHEGRQRRRTEVQKFLDGRFVQSFRREDLLREVIIPSLPELPAAHGSPDASDCADALAWTLEVIGLEEPEGLLPLLARLPVACTRGWLAMREAVFGPGWAGRCGDHLMTLADGLSREEGEELLRSALLPPSDERWLPRGSQHGGVSDPRGIELAGRADLFARAGVVDGLRLEACKPIRFGMSRDHPRLADKAPAGIPQAAWDNWKQAVLGKVKPEWKSWFEYKLQDVTVLPILHREHLGDPARTALSNLILASLAHWKNGWEKVTIRRSWWSQQITSPLKHWLSTLLWLHEGSGETHMPPREPRPLRKRWLVPESLVRGQKGRFRHLAPLSLPLAHRLAQDEGLLEALGSLGLNIYPTEDAQTGPDLLDALADVVMRQMAMPAGGFDVFLGQVRHAWRRFGPDRELPERFLVLSKPRTFTVRTASELRDVYLPDDRARTRSLREHEQPILEMRPEEARDRIGIRLHELGARRASELEENCLVDGHQLAAPMDGAQTLEEGRLSWLPVVLLTLAAHGGNNPRGPATDAWQRTAERLVRSRVRRCDSIEVELRHAGSTVAPRVPRSAHWLSREGVLLLNRNVARSCSYEEVAAASQAILRRQDLLKDLRLVLGYLSGTRLPTRGMIDAALDRAEIDTELVGDIRDRWYVLKRVFLDRIPPVAELFGVLDGDFDDAAVDTDRLAKWLSQRIPQWPSEDLLATARECHDDFEMGFAAWRKLGDDAELPKWNRALRRLGGKYAEVENDRAPLQGRRRLLEAARWLRAFARHVAKKDRRGSGAGDWQAALFSEIEAVHERIGTRAKWQRCCEDWSRRYWRVPFGAVLDVLCDEYEGIAAVEPYLEALRGVRTVDELKSVLSRKDVDLKVDPLDLARRNQHRLRGAVRSMWQLYQTWRMAVKADSERFSEAPEVSMDSSMHLREWSGRAELLRRALEVIADPEFLDACAGCETITEVRKKLDLPEPPKGKGGKRPPPKVVIDGEEMEIVGRDSYQDLFFWLEERCTPTGRPVGPLQPKPVTPGPTPSPVPVAPEVDVRGPKIAHAPAHIPELVGIVGEIHAFHYLQSKFDISEDAWVSQFRTKVKPLRQGEEDKTSDSFGYDFRFERDGMTWCVEVKATTDNGTSFELASGQIAAARRIASSEDEAWHILRVRLAWSKQPECDWLPNPFDPGSDQHLRLREGSMTVEYALSRDSEDAQSAASTPQAVPEDQ